MPLKRLVILALLIAVTPCWAGERDKRDTGSRDGTRSVTNRRTDSRRTRDVPNEDRPILNEKPNDGLRPIAGIPRAVMKKVPNFELIPANGAGGSIIVKFMDQVKARCEEGKVTSYAGVDLSALDKLIRNNSLEVEPLFKISFARLAAIEDKAVRFSNKDQPDLASMMKISGPRGRILQAARQLNDMAIVEYVEFEQTTVTAMQGVVMACCIQNGAGEKINCVTVSLQDCIAMSGAPNENAIGPGACFDGDSDGVADACVGACCYEDQLTLPVCQSGVSPIDCASDPFFIAASFRGLGTRCRQDGGIINCDLRGACCIDPLGTTGGDNFCVFLTKEDCLARGEVATFTTAGRDCDETVDDPCTPAGCGDDTAGSCFVPTPPPIGGTDPSGNSPFCEQDNCCQTVCQLIPECCDDNLDNPGDWNQICARFANIFRIDSRDDINICFGPPPPPLGPCNISGIDCFAGDELGDLIAPSPGCSIFSCCISVCLVDPLCCDNTWDAGCVATAKLLCPFEPEDFIGVPPDFGAPDFYSMGVQGYLTPVPYTQDPQANFIMPEAIIDGLFLPSCIGAGRSTPDIPAFRTRPSFLETISGFAGEGFDIPGLEAVGRALSGLQGNFGDISMSQGKTIKIGVIDHSAYIKDSFGLGIHKDLEDRVEIIPSDRPITMFPPPLTDPDHGTAVLGILAAIPDNGFGINSMAPESEVFFFPASSLEDGGRLLAAMVDVVENFDPGDVVYIPLGTGQFGINGCGLLLSDLSTWLMAQMLTNAGITVVIPADNNSCDLAANPQASDIDGSDAGAIIVGACSPGLPFTRIGASNHCSTCSDNTGDIVHVSAWGAAVATLGYGDMYDGGDTSDPTNNYTNSFRYTSAAGAQITALVARYQGLAKQMYGMPFTPRQIRGTENFTTVTGVFGLFHPDFLISQDNRSPAPPLGSPNGLECLGDFSFQEDPNRIAGFPDARGGAAWAIIGPHFGQSSRLEGMIVIRGKHIYGTRFALGAIDRNYVIVESEFTNRDQKPAAVSPPDPTLRSIQYLASGQITDIVVDLEAELSVIEQLDVQYVLSSTTNTLVDFNLIIVELFDWTSRRWDFVGFEFTNPSDTLYISPVLFGVQRFVRALDDKVKVRIYTIGLGNLGTTGIAGAATSTYTVRYDFVHIDIGVLPPGNQIEYPEPP
ncbi:MAG: S8 family serine peptidase [Planctomycetes bacterium]|nr:S8 family serine peptidase [Planctomycetota bacterium]